MNFSALWKFEPRVCERERGRKRQRQREKQREKMIYDVVWESLSLTE